MGIEEKDVKITLARYTDLIRKELAVELMLKKEYLTSDDKALLLELVSKSEVGRVIYKLPDEQEWACDAKGHFNGNNIRRYYKSK